MSRTARSASWRALIPLSLLALTAASCAGGEESGETPAANGSTPVADRGETATLRIGAIPDQEPDRLQRTNALLAEHLAVELGDFDIDVEYVPVTDYQGAVTGFAVGDPDAVWFGGLTGVQARLEVDGAEALVQRDIDEVFTSVFIARADVGLEPIDDVAGLAELEGRSFTFGSHRAWSHRPPTAPRYWFARRS